MNKLGPLDDWAVGLLGALAGVVALALGAGLMWYCYKRRSDRSVDTESSPLLVNASSSSTTNRMRGEASADRYSLQQKTSYASRSSPSSTGRAAVPPPVSFETNRSQAARKARERQVQRAQAAEDVVTATRLVLRGTGFVLSDRNRGGKRELRFLGYRAQLHGGKFHVLADPEKGGGSKDAQVLSVSVCLPGTRAARWFGEPFKLANASPASVRSTTRGQVCVVDVLKAIDHPFIEAITRLQHVKMSISTPAASDKSPSAGNKTDLHTVCVFRKLSSKGSVRDLICSAKPREDYVPKYGSQVLDPLGWTGRPLGLRRIQKIGKCVAEAMEFLVNHCGVSCIHVHSGNVLVDSEGNARLADSLENDLLAIHTPLYAAHLRAKFFRDGASEDDAASLQKKMQPEVVVFGCLLYEMAVGEPMAVIDVNKCADLPTSVPAEVAYLLKGIFKDTTPELAAAADAASGDENAAELSQRRGRAVWNLTQVVDADLFAKVELYSSWAPQVPDIPSDVQRLLKRALRAPLKDRLRAPVAAKGGKGGRSGTPSRRGTVSRSTTPSSATTNSPAPATAPVARPVAPQAPAAPSAPAPPPAPSPAPPSSGRGALLASIRQGKSLQKAHTNDRSAPKV